MPETIGTALQNSGSALSGWGMPGIGGAISGWGNSMNPGGVMASINPDTTPGAPPSLPSATNTPAGGALPAPPSPDMSIAPMNPTSADTQLGNLAAAGYPGATRMVTDPSSPNYGIPIPGSVDMSGTTMGSPTTWKDAIASAVGGLFNPSGGPGGVRATDLAQMWDMYNKWSMQRKLMNPNYLSSQAAQMMHPLGRALKADTARSVMSTAAEGGYAGSPGMVRTATAEALAPYQEANRNAALQSELESMQLAMQEDPAGAMNQFSQFLQMMQLEDARNQAAQAQSQAASY